MVQAHRGRRGGVPTFLIGTAFIVAMVLIGAPHPAHALECPVPHPTTTATAIKETEQQIREYATLLAAQGGVAVPKLVGSVKRKYPNASNAEVTNYLVTLYCPALEQNAALSEGEKRARLEAFSSRIMRELVP